MADAIHLDRILESLDDRILSDHFFKKLWSEFSCDDLVFHLVCCGRTVPLGPGPGDTVSHRVTHYRCFLPDLAGFAGANCTAPHEPVMDVATPVEIGHRAVLPLN